MREIGGFVLVRETDAAIHRVVVAAFDAGGAPEIMRKRAPTAEVMKALGRRIASVLTDSTGSFSFPPEDLEFPGNEPRPDLVLVVFAPEDVDNPAHPYPAPPEDRVLYMSVVPRIDAGAREAFLIRLSREVVAKHRIDAGETRVASAFEATWKTRDAIANGLKERHLAELGRKAAARRQAVKAAGNLHGVPVALRKNKLLVVGKAALSESVGEGKDKSTRAEVLQRDLMFEGLTQIKKRADGRSPKMQLHLGPKELETLGLSIEDGKVVGDLDREALWETVVKLNGGIDLTRKRGLANPSPAELERRYLKADQEPVETTKSTDATKKKTKTRGTAPRGRK